MSLASLGDVDREGAPSSRRSHPRPPLTVAMGTPSSSGPRASLSFLERGTSSGTRCTTPAAESTGIVTSGRASFATGNGETHSLYRCLSLCTSLLSAMHAQANEVELNIEGLPINCLT